MADNVQRFSRDFPANWCCIFFLMQSLRLNSAARDMEGQQFCLRWHNFQNTLLSSLPKLLDGGYLTDVTLSAGGRHIHAHRIILSACSYYFKELFKDLSALQHPVIVLPGMEYANLCALVKFMYNGEVNIYQEQLPALLAMADTLHICGLADMAGVT